MPMAYRSDKHVKLIGGCLGEVLELDSDGILWDKSARVRVSLDVTQPCFASSPACCFEERRLGNGRD